MRWCAIALGLMFGCRPAASPEGPSPGAAPARALCDGLTDAACEDRALMHAACLTEPTHAGCEALRAGGWLPPSPGELTAWLGCWQVDAPRAEARDGWVCIEPTAIAIRAESWDVWPHGGWRRDDAPDHAAWSAATDDGRRLWLTIAAGRPHLAVSRGLIAVGLQRGDVAARAAIATERDELPSIAEVCAAAAACVRGLPRPAPFGDEVPPLDPLVFANTLRECLAGWDGAAAELSGARAFGAVTAIPPACGTLDSSSWTARIVPPFAGVAR